MNIDKNTILEKYLRLAVRDIHGANFKSNHINFRCNICGDGNKKTNKRGHLLLSKSRKTYEEFWIYKCFNEGCRAEVKTWSGENWLKWTSPYLYKDYVKEVFVPIKNNKKTKEEELKLKELSRLDDISKKKMATRKENKAIKFFIPITCNDNKHRDLLDKAISLCTTRKIPENIWKNWFVATDDKYIGRIIIPFYDKKNKIYYYQARDLIGNDPKYLNRIQDKDKALYNIHNIDTTKPVIVLEGIIDSLFVNNSLAVIGLALSEYIIDKLSKLNVHYLLDNDKAGKHKSKKLLEEGKSVFLWNRWKYKDCKDINEIVIKYGITSFDFDELKYYFTTNVYDTLYLEM
jgi:hypothetical protein